MFSLPAHRVQRLEEQGVDGAETIGRLIENPHRLLITILVGNNLANIGMSSIATGLLALFLSRGHAVLAATVGVTTLVLLFGESAPKSYAVEHTESWALRVARLLELSAKVFAPVVTAVDVMTKQINRLTGGRAAMESSFVSRSEIQEIIRTGEREGVIDREERELLQRIFRFNNVIVKEVMTPRLDITAVPSSATIDEAIHTLTDSGHRRAPVYRSSLDSIVGTLTLSDAIDMYFSGDQGRKLSDVDLESSLQVPESKDVSDLLQEMQRKRVEIAVVIDEFGTTEGIVTTEDIVEAIVGEILEAEEPNSLTIHDETTVDVDGSINIHEVNDALGINLPEEEAYETIAGFIYNKAGRLVEEGEEFMQDGVEIVVADVDRTRISRAVIHTPDPHQHAADSSSDGAGSLLERDPGR